MRLLITGASGQLGAYLLRELRGTSDTVIAWSGTKSQTLFGFAVEPVNFTEAQIIGAFRRASPDVVIHAAALASIAACYRDPERACAINVQASSLLANLACDAGADFVLVSTDLVFDGARGVYREGDVPSPLSSYGKTKLAAEEAMQVLPNTAVARLSLLYGPTLIGRPGFFDEQVSALRQQQPIHGFVDEWRTPLDYPTAARALLALARGVFNRPIHIGGPERLSRWEMACKTAAVLGLDSKCIMPVERVALSAPEPRPRDTSLDSSLWRALFPEQPWPTMEEALGDMMINES